MKKCFRNYSIVKKYQGPSPLLFEPDDPGTMFGEGFRDVSCT